MKKFEFDITVENTGYWIAKGIITAKNEKQAEQKLLAEDFDIEDEESVEWEMGDECNHLSLYEHNGELLAQTLKNIRLLTTDKNILQLIDKTFNNLAPTIYINNLIQLDDEDED